MRQSTLLLCRAPSLPIIVIAMLNAAHASDSFSFYAAMTTVGVTPSDVFVQGTGLETSGNNTKAVRLGSKGGSGCKNYRNGGSNWRGQYCVTFNRSGDTFKLRTVEKTFVTGRGILERQATFSVEVQGPSCSVNVESYALATNHGYRTDQTAQVQGFGCKLYK
jgi:hypothetical protein